MTPDDELEAITSVIERLERELQKASTAKERDSLTEARETLRAMYGRIENDMKLRLRRLAR